MHLIGNRTRDLAACSIVPQPTTLPRAPQIPYDETLLATWQPYRSIIDILQQPITFYDLPIDAHFERSKVKNAQKRKLLIYNY
jgi:hypothetical protein